ncbi:uncharacterized protein LOC125246756 isoform X2 [Megalobrama amblycephala]|uniref:uncharacterized protein LOC125246756 isoform X2 n=1 Tax=Megalobrama amblycephala TaxID=75352 RepID=UPI0020144CB4|nr:uncharacterized protein LOC125246756 isoform X2 [Megalobrama amblycephala]XP_048013747.1 uncharacterized protein LOC125246756 isoform X2 [Megalobrama amblycephala]XP_048013757.1 uncharacterized protein LOC125246756 isoform X2 [Megalobrama amblycephala]
MLSVFLFLLLIYGVSDKETEESKPEPMTVMEGDSVTLHTDLTEVMNDDTILWLFGPKDLLISQMRRKDDFTPVFFTDDPGFRGRLQVDQKTGSLTIRNTRTRHTGQYKLTISREITTTKTFNVTVIAVVGETDGMKSESVSVTEGESVTLRNDAEIQKDALMLWRFGDKGVLLAKIDIEANKTSLHDADERFRDRLQLDLHTGSLIITKTRTTDSGLYELQIRGIESSRRFLLSVSAVPGPQLSSGAKAGIGVGFLILVLLLVAAALAAIYYHHRNFKLKKKMEEEKKSVMEGDSLTLFTDLTNIHGIDTIEWCYEAEDNRFAEINKRKINILSTSADGRFRSKLRLNEKTGDLTINNIRTIHSGLYILKISSSSSRKSGCGTKSTTRTKRKRFIVTVGVRTLTKKVGERVTLKTDAELQSGDLMLWTFGPENRLVVKTDSGRTSISESFRNRLELDNETGSLTITNIEITDSGHFKLQIINSKRTTFRRFNVTLIEEQENEETPLINVDVPVGVNEQQATSSI